VNFKKRSFVQQIVGSGYASQTLLFFLMLLVILPLANCKKSNDFDIIGNWTVHLTTKDLYPGESENDSMDLTFSFTGTPDTGTVYFTAKVRQEGNNYDDTASGNGSFYVNGESVNFSITIPDAQSFDDYFEGTLVFIGSFIDSNTIKGTLQKTYKGDKDWGPITISIKK